MVERVVRFRFPSGLVHPPIIGPLLCRPIGCDLDGDWAEREYGEGEDEGCEMTEEEEDDDEEDEEIGAEAGEGEGNCDCCCGCCCCCCENDCCCCGEKGCCACSGLPAAAEEDPKKDPPANRFSSHNWLYLNFSSSISSKKSMSKAPSSTC